MLLKAGLVLQIYKVLLWIITVVSALFIGRYWGRKQAVASMDTVALQRAVLNAEAAIKGDDEIKQELEKWVVHKE